MAAMPLDLTADTITLLEQLVNIEFGEPQRAARSPTRSRRRCGRCRTSTVTRHGNNVVVRTDARAGPERLVMVGHIDTVPPNGTSPVPDGDALLGVWARPT